AVYAALEFQAAVGAATADLKDHFLETMHAILTGAHQVHAPTPVLRIARVHAVEVGRENGRFVAAGPAPDLDDYVLLVVRIVGHEGLLDLLLKDVELAAQ